jgi:hypothetical protein
MRYRVLRALPIAQLAGALALLFVASTRATGTFTFTVVAVPGLGTGTRSITEGVFTVTL